MVKLENGGELEPLPDHEVVCFVHGITVTWGELDPIQQLAVEEGLDTPEDSECLLAMRREK